MAYALFVFLAFVYFWPYHCSFKMGAGLGSGSSAAAIGAGGYFWPVCIPTVVVHHAYWYFMRTRHVFLACMCTWCVLFVFGLYVCRHVFFGLVPDVCFRPACVCSLGLHVHACWTCMPFWPVLVLGRHWCLVRVSGLCHRSFKMEEGIGFFAISAGDRCAFFLDYSIY